MRFVLIMFACAFASTLTVHGQSKSQKPKPKTADGYYNTQADWYNQKRGKQIGIDRILTSIDGKTIDFNQLQHPTFVNFGFYGCHPCEHELPVYIEAATIHPDIDFVYITYDNEETRQREFSEVTKPDFKPAANYYFVHMDRQEINRRDLTLGYPTKYFLNKTGIVQMVTSGGSTSELASEILERIAKIIA